MLDVLGEDPSDLFYDAQVRHSNRACSEGVNKRFIHHVLNGQIGLRLSAAERLLTRASRPGGPCSLDISIINIAYACNNYYLS